MHLFNAERQAQRDSSSYSLVELSKALWQIRPDSRLLAAVTEVLLPLSTTCSGWMLR